MSTHKRNSNRADGSESEDDTSESMTLSDDAAEVISSSVGKQLKKLYGEVVDESVPDRFSQLLDELAEKEKNNQ